MKKLLILVLSILLCFALIACNKGETGAQGEQGPQGLPGENGVGIVSIVKISTEENVDTYRILYSDESESFFSVTNGTNSDNDTEGKYIISITKSEINERGELVFTFSDGNTVNAGKVVGSSIEKIEFNDQGRVVVTLSDGTVLAPLEIPNKSEHEHNFGEWINYNNDSNVNCEIVLFYHFCNDCNIIEWKKGSYENHRFETVTTPPSCSSEGYDTNTCVLCGFVEKNNYTEITGHIYKDVYSYDKLVHWLECKQCDFKKEYGEHTTDNTGFCTICNQPVTPTEGISYTLSEDGTYAEVESYSGTAKKIVIADTYKGVPVTNICNNAFKENHTIVSVLIPNSVTAIGDYAFYACDNLIDVTIGTGLVSIGRDTFGECDFISNVYISDISQWLSINFSPDYGGSGYEYANPLANVSKLYLNGELVEHLIIPEDVTIISEAAFNGCISIRSVYIHKNIEKIPGNAFQGCSNLEKVEFEANSKLKTIGLCAFEYCEKLETFDMPDTVTAIDKWAFQGCSALEMELSKGLTYVGFRPFPLQMCEIEDGCYYVQNWLIEGYYGDSGVVSIREGTIGIADSAFYAYYSDSITSLIIPASVQYICFKALERQTALKTVTIAEGSLLKTIESRAFYGCTALESINLPSKLEYIGSYAFYGCTTLESINLSSKLEYIGAYCFAECTFLKSVTWDTEYDWILSGKIYFYKDELHNDTRLAEYLLSLYTNYTWVKFDIS